MKILPLIFVVLTSAATAQLLPPAGEEWKGGPLKEAIKKLEAAGITELKAGTVTVPVKNLTALSASSARYVNASGIGRLALTDLPAEVREKLGYDPTAAAGHEQAKEAATKKAENDTARKIQEQRDATAMSALREKLKAQVIAESVVAEITVDQTLDNGVRVSWLPAVRDNDTFTASTDGFLLGYTKKIVDGDRFTGRIYPAGRYKAKLALGGAPVVLRAWTVTPEAAVARIESGEE